MQQERVCVLASSSPEMISQAQTLAGLGSGGTIAASSVSGITGLLSVKDSSFTTVTTVRLMSAINSSGAISTANSMQKLNICKNFILYSNLSFLNLW